MDIKLLGPELENVQSAAQRELDETIERRKREVENEVITSLSEIASDGKRVLKSQKSTYEMMLQLDGLVKENEELFLKVNALCDKTGVSLNAIIERMVKKNRELRGEQPVAEPTIETPSVEPAYEEPVFEAPAFEETPVEMPTVAEDDKKKADAVAEGFRGIEDIDIPEFEYNPDDIKYDWQKSVFSNPQEVVTQNIPTDTYTASTELASEPETSTLSAELEPSLGFMRVKARRLHDWDDNRQRSDALVRAVILGENLEGKSEDYRNVGTQIGNLLLHYRDFTPEEDNVSLDTLDQSIGASSTLGVSEKRKLYRRLNTAAKKVERYARTYQAMAR